MSALPKIQTEYSSTYKRVNVAGIFGGLIPGGLEAIVFSQERRIEGVLETEPVSQDKLVLRRTIEVELLIDPIQLKAIHKWLGEKITEYEEIIGDIPSSKEIDDKARVHPEQ